MTWRCWRWTTPRATPRASSSPHGPPATRAYGSSGGRVGAWCGPSAWRPALAGCGTGFRYFPREALGSGYRRYERWLNGLRSPAEVVRDLFVECPVAHPTLMLRRSAYEAAGGYRDAGWPEDYDLVLRLHAAGCRLANLPRVLLRWRVRPDRLSMRSGAYSAEAFRRCKAHFLAKSFLPPARS